jgi:hypothetical protein
MIRKLRQPRWVLVLLVALAVAFLYAEVLAVWWSVPQLSVRARLVPTLGVPALASAAGVLSYLATRRNPFLATSAMVMIAFAALILLLPF